MTKYMSVCLSVRDMEASKRFYTELLGQKIEMDLGANVCFTGFALQTGFAEMLRIPRESVVYGSNAAELYFEVEELEPFLSKLDGWEGIEYVHRMIEQPWRQRVVRFYDPDRHVVEVGEDMVTTVCRVLREGASVEEAAAQTMMPLPFVGHCKTLLQK